MDSVVENTPTDSMNISVSDFTQHLSLIEQQLEFDPDNQTLISVKNDILKFLELANSNITGAITDVMTPSQSIEHTEIVVGEKYSIQYTNYTGEITTRNCIIMEIDSTSNSAVVLFTHPTEQSMLPCQYFLEGNCKFEEECKHSHGYKVDLSLIDSYEEIDISQAQEDAACLVYDSNDGIWNNGIIIKKFDTKCEVWVDRLNRKEQVPINDLFLLKTRTNEFLQSSGEDSEFECRTISGSSSPPVIKEFNGEVSWERHTRGIGSKLMSRMGYIPGSGLGVEGNGIKDPVEIVVLPKRRSLDQCMESKLKGTIKKEKIIHKYKRSITKKEFKNKSADSVNLDVFDFLNDSIHLQQLVHSENERKENNLHNYTRNDKKGLDVSHSRRLQLDRQLRDARTEVEKLKLSLYRNRKDSVIAKQIEIKLKKGERDLSLLEQEESNINFKISSQKKRANMAVF
ncbi:hypothetical protein LOD99_13266 [Oopsacas minuta]|uniref:Zinc finger CCCH-type with G patch domain-containing protein n=1 Tax=Oopsacas minuta TaxID=111878 RepID=A0AAV7JBF0_9METZ|nr:hypothetical protein LOD99_13266 [Oopsacas minuta]